MDAKCNQCLCRFPSQEDLKLHSNDWFRVHLATFPWIQLKKLFSLGCLIFWVYHVIITFAIQCTSSVQDGNVMIILYSWEKERGLDECMSTNMRHAVTMLFSFTYHFFFRNFVWFIWSSEWTLKINSWFFLSVGFRIPTFLELIITWFVRNWLIS